MTCPTPGVGCVCVECLIGKQNKPTLFKVTEPSSVPYRTPPTLSYTWITFWVLWMTPLPRKNAAKAKAKAHGVRQKGGRGSQYEREGSYWTQTRPQTPARRSYSGLKILGTLPAHAGMCVCVLLLQDLLQSCSSGGGGEWRTCAMRDDEPRPVWMSLPITH